MQSPRGRDLAVLWFLSVLWSGELLGHERITARAVAGGALILSGVVTVTVRTRAPSAAAPAAAG
ncbi:MAG TPA: hypothetical protein VGK70_11100 [Thermoanaerobaculia bacterium]